MFDFIAWFAKDASPARTDELQRRAEAHLRNCTPAGWRQQSWSGDGWTVVVRHAQMPDWKWSFAERSAGLHAVAAGFPLGLGPTTPVDLAGRLVAGEDVHTDVTVPFALLALDDASGRLAVQQDWHGMGQVFRYETPAALMLSNRPSSMPTVLGEPVLPQLEGWSYYLGTDTFAGGSSPVRGVRQLHPGERLLGERSRGTWRFTSERGRDLDDLVAEALERPASLDEVISDVHAGIARSVRDLAHYWPHGLTMGLSGGKDSRLLAAVILAEGHTPSFKTNEENPVEGEVARSLAERLRSERGLSVDHELYVATERDQVLEHTVLDRATEIQRRNDFMFRANYLKRPPEPPQATLLEAPSLTGIFGEYVTGYWIPDRLPDDATLTHDHARRVLRRRLATGAPWSALRPRPRQRLDEFVEGLMDRARDLGLAPVATINYGYMLGRIRRATTALTHPEQVMPMGVPEMVRASMQLSREDAVGERVHTTLIDRLVPEWSGVPFVMARTGVDRSKKLRIWHGTGQQELEGLLDGDPGPISRLLKRKDVAEALRQARQGNAEGPEDRLLRQFAMAVAAERVMDDPEGVSRR